MFQRAFPAPHTAAFLAVGLLTYACGESAPVAADPFVSDAGAPSQPGPDLPGDESAASTGGPAPSDGDTPGEVDPSPVPYDPIDIPANGYVFRVWVSGPESAETVLLLHGFPQTSYEWHDVVPALVAAGYRVVAPDQRGYSPGARPHDDAAYAVLAIANDAAALMDALAVEAFHVVGHDWGGGIAWLLAKMLPQRALSLTAVGTPHPDAMKAQLEDETSCQHQASAYFDEVVKPDAAARFVRDPSSVLDVEKDPLTDTTPYLGLFTDLEAMDAVFAWYRANIEDRKFNTLSMGDVDVPSLLVLGEEEPFFCRDTAELSAAYVSADFSLHSLPDVGHWIPEQAAAAFNPLLLEHLARHRGRVSGSRPPGPDMSRPLAHGSSGFACKGAPQLVVPGDLESCDDTCPDAHCVHESALGQLAELGPACAQEGHRCVPDALTEALGRFSFESCRSWLLGEPSVCVPRCLTGVQGIVLGRDGCNEGEVCAPCVNPFSGQPTGACGDFCQGL